MPGCPLEHCSGGGAGLGEAGSCELEDASEEGKFSSPVQDRNGAASEFECESMLREACGHYRCRCGLGGVFAIAVSVHLLQGFPQQRSGASSIAVCERVREGL